MDLLDPVTTLSGVGDQTAARLGKLGITTVFDLLYHLPFRYEDRTLVTQIDRIQSGETVTVSGTLIAIKNEFTRRGKVLQIGTVQDSSGQLQLVWFNQRFLPKTLVVGETYSFFGKADLFNKKLSLVVPEIEKGTSKLHTGRIVPIYPETAGLSSRVLRQHIYKVIDQLKFADFLPATLQLLPWKQCLQHVHFPPHTSAIAEARERLALDELILLQMKSFLRKQQWQSVRTANQFAPHPIEIDKFISRLPFNLTASQNQAISEIIADLGKLQPMNRLLEGDVGSGKTVVAAVAAYLAYLNGKKTLVMAPTQILANQHFATLSSYLKPLGVKSGLATAATKNFDDQTQVLVGTHSLISNAFMLADVGLVVIDEQHRFGVAQRALAGSKGIFPHVLTMTATPIPRTIALTMYGDLEVSVLSELPSGRKPVKTWTVPDAKRQRAYDWIKAQIDTNSAQVFVVCPFIDESETMQSVKAATTEYDKLVTIFKPHKVGLLHGKLKAAEKTKIIEDFATGTYQVLVATPVVEVGIDIPGATIMVIEAAERFGLAQLHQLRGRVGRNSIQSYCLLFANSQSQRLKAMEKFSSGLKLAEIDLKLRGPGDVYGTMQHGIAGFKVAKLDQVELFEQSQLFAQKLLDQLPGLPLLRMLLETDKIGLVQPN